MRAIAERAAGTGDAEGIGSTISREASCESMIASTASSSTGGMATSTASLLLRMWLASLCSMSRSKMLDSVAATDAETSLCATLWPLMTRDPPPTSTGEKT